MSESNGFFNKYFRMFVVILIAIPVVLLAVLNIGVVGNVLLVLLGFGAVVIVHEFGHFVVAKWSGIKVEAFSLFMPPILLGVQRTEDGIRVRILPEIFSRKDDESGHGALGFTVGRKGKPGETEYRIGLIPFGGFVKMLGQDDTAAATATDDPRSYANKPPHIRAAVLAAGVTFNVISAVIIFMVAFLKGIDLPPAAVGGVIPDSPAAHAGLKEGDEILEIAGKTKDLDFSDIAIAAALSGRDEKVAMKVRRTDGEEETLSLVAEQLLDEPMRGFGIIAPRDLTVANLSKSDANELLQKTGLLPGDRIVAVDGKPVGGHWELAEIVQDLLRPAATLSVERVGDQDQIKMVESKVSLEMSPAGNRPVESESALGHVYSMVPRLRIADVSQTQQAPVEDANSSLQRGDVILAVGDVNNPTFKELRDIVAQHKDTPLAVRVLRADADGRERALTVTVIPKQAKGSERVLIGIEPVLDAEHPIVAKTIAAEGGPAKLEIPRGAAITAVDGQAVSDFYDVIREIRRYPASDRITIDWRLDERTAGSVALNIGAGSEFITIKSTFSQEIPFDSLRRTYKASGPVDAVVMGYRRTVMFVAQTYLTLKRLLGGLVSPKNLMGPVGIITFSYRIVSQQPLVYYVYFLGLISAVIAVFNFLPLPPLDGGLVLLLLVEKAKGSALTERIQTIIAYAGWALILTLILYVTFNDIVRSFFS
ncbi:MAG TPA: site-2 protease family protein [Sedimentisphaerales bacterium]|nr:site-2 protease family protein [Sedimentisphaerales bacterium]